jgi:hypothetical protein
MVPGTTSSREEKMVSGTKLEVLSNGQNGARHNIINVSKPYVRASAFIFFSRFLHIFCGYAAKNRAIKATVGCQGSASLHSLR